MYYRDNISNALEYINDNLENDISIDDISNAAGFNSHEVFTRAFTSLYGISPLKYRKNRKEILLYERFNNFGKSIKNRFKYKDDININVEVIEKRKFILLEWTLKLT